MAASTILLPIATPFWRLLASLFIIAITSGSNMCVFVTEWVYMNINIYMISMLFDTDKLHLKAVSR